MVWQVAAGVALGIAPFFFFGCGLVTSLDLGRKGDDGQDVHWRAGIWFAVGAMCLMAIMVKTILVPYMMTKG